MKNFKVTTRSGSVWTYTDGIMHVDTSHGSRYAFKPMLIAPLNPKTVQSWRDNGAIDWNRIRELEERFPETGLHLYAAGLRDWRISSIVESVEELPDDEEAIDD